MNIPCQIRVRGIITSNGRRAALNARVAGSTVNSWCPKSQITLRGRAVMPSIRKIRLFGEHFCIPKHTHIYIYVYIYKISISKMNPLSHVWSCGAASHQITGLLRLLQLIQFPAARRYSLDINAYRVVVTRYAAIPYRLLCSRKTIEIIATETR
jgi:hypothetical protein